MYRRKKGTNNVPKFVVKDWTYLQIETTTNSSQDLKMLSILVIYRFFIILM